MIPTQTIFKASILSLSDLFFWFKRGQSPKLKTEEKLTTNSDLFSLREAQNCPQRGTEARKKYQVEKKAHRFYNLNAP